LKIEDQFSNNYKILVLVSITASRAIYALNWYDLSPGLAKLAADFHVTLPSLGILESAFILGAGIFQIPSAFAAARWNPKLLAVSGMIAMGAANVLFSLAPTFDLLIVLRFVLGVGASMFFSPGLAVVAPLFRGQRQGLAVGIYNGAFNAGGAAALFGWALLIPLIGWRFSLLAGGLLSILLGIENQIVVKHDTGVQKTLRNLSNASSALRGVLVNKQIWLMSIGFIGLWAALYSVVQLIPYYEEIVRGADPFVASSLATIVFVLPIAIGPVAGHLSDKLHNRKAFLIYPGLAFGIATALIGYANVLETGAIMAVLGVTDALVFMALYAIPFESKELREEQKAIAISLMNSVQIAGSFIIPILFSIVASSFLGFQTAWVLLGAIALGFLPAAFFVKDPLKKNADLR
jgi:MFS family permease